MPHDLTVLHDSFVFIRQNRKDLIRWPFPLLFIRNKETMVQWPCELFGLRLREMECDREDDDPGRKVTWNYCDAFNGRPLPVKIFFFRERETYRKGKITFLLFSLLGLMTDLCAPSICLLWDENGELLLLVLCQTNSSTRWGGKRIVGITRQGLKKGWRALGCQWVLWFSFFFFFFLLGCLTLTS